MRLLASPLFRYAAGLCLLVFLIANSANPPTGRTAAPFDGTCGDSGCHNPQSSTIAGNVVISGLPATIIGGTTYPMMITVTATAGSPTVGGFQLVAVQGNNNNAGDLVNLSGETGTEMLAAREYIEHRNSKTISGGSVSWDFNWIAPNSSNGNIVKFYFTGNLANGNTNSSGDKIVSGNQTFTFMGGVPLSASISATTNLACNGVNTGSATGEGAGGSPPYTYMWSNGQNTQTAVNLPAGNFTVTVKDATNATATAVATITQPPALTLTATSSNAISCIVGSSTLTANAGGGTPPFTFAWSNGDSGNPITVSVPGTYTVVMTDFNGCTKNAPVTVTGNTTPPNAAAAAGSPLSCTSSTTTVFGNGSSVGPNFTYQWTTVNGNIVSGSTTLNCVVSQPGSYCLLVVNTINGCTASSCATVTGDTTPPTTATTGTSLTCANASDTIFVSTNAATATFSWTGPNGFSSPNQNPIIGAAGTYFVVVTNTINGCSRLDSTTVLTNTTAPTVATSGDVITCADPSAQLVATSNAANASFVWRDAGGNIVSTNSLLTTTLSGTYTATATNPANGCTASTTALADQNLTPPGATATGSTITCTAPTATLSGNSGAPISAWSWSGPNGYTSNLQNPTTSTDGIYTLVATSSQNGCTSSTTATVGLNTTPPGATANSTTITCAAPTATLSGNSGAAISAWSWTGPNGYTSNLQNPTTTTDGTYNLVATSSTNGCTSLASTVVALNTTLPTAAAAQPGNLNCTNSSIVINGSGSSQGTNFSYLWTTANGQIVSGGNTLTPTVNAAGSYNLLVTNSINGCTSTTSANVSQSPAVTAAISASQNVGCNGGSNGSATVAGGGGIGPLSYLWSNGNTTVNINNLAAGSYSVVVTDAENCTATTTATVGEPAILAANASATGESASGANDGTANAAPTGGTAPFGYLWSNSMTNPSISGLAPGSYTVVVTDANGCSATQTVNVNSFNCNLAASATSQNVSCFGANNGSATAILGGAAQPVSYLWSNGGTTETISGLAPGNYSVQMQDGNGCPATLSVTINEPTLLAANATSTGETASGGNDGTASAAPTGGTLPYSFFWNTGATTASISGLAPGNYSVIITDGNGCSSQQSVNVAQFNCALSSNVQPINVTCFGLANGQATASLTGGTAPFIYTWSNGQSGPTATGLSPGSFSVQISDAFGCLTSQQFSITEPSQLTSGITISAQNICENGQDGAASLSQSGGTQPATWVWSNGQTGATVSGLPVGPISVVVTDVNGCKSTSSAQISFVDNVPPTLVCPASQTGCEGDLITFSQPVGADNCSLAGSQLSQLAGLQSGQVFPLGTTLQTFQLLDASGNSVTCSFNIEIFANPTVSIDATSNDVDNQGVGSISISSNGNSFSWTKNGQPFSTDQDLTGLMAGSYVCTILNADGCEVKTAPILIDNTVATVEIDGQNGLKIYPNPARNAVKIEVGTAISSARMMDSRGRLVSVFSSENWNDELNVEHLSEGIYSIIVLTVDAQILTGRFVKIGH